MNNYLRRSNRRKPYRSSSGSDSKTRLKNEAAPELPHERDESAKGSTDPVPAPEMKQAARDLRRGLVDTDKGPEMERAYQRQRAR